MLGRNEKMKKKIHFVDFVKIYAADGIYGG